MNRTLLRKNRDSNNGTCAKKTHTHTLCNSAPSKEISLFFLLRPRTIRTKKSLRIQLHSLKMQNVQQCSGISSANWKRKKIEWLRSSIHSFASFFKSSFRCQNERLCHSSFIDFTVISEMVKLHTYRPFDRWINQSFALASNHLTHLPS